MLMTKWSVRSKLLIPVVAIIIVGGLVTFFTLVYFSLQTTKHSLPEISKLAELEANILNLVGEYHEFLVAYDSDTPADIACGVAYGARTIAVATGTFSRDELAAHDPDVLFDSLEDTDAVWHAITD